MDSVKSVLVKHAPENPPLLSALVSTIAHDGRVKYRQTKGFDGHEAQVVPSGDVIQGDAFIGRLIARLNNDKEPFLNGASAVEATQIDYWLGFAESIGKMDEDPSSPKAIRTFVATWFKPLDNHLALRTYVVGNHLTVADLAVWLGLSNSFKINAKLSSSLNQAKFVKRWYNFLCQYPAIQDVYLSQFTEKKAEKPQKKAAEKGKPSEAAEKGKRPERSINIGHTAKFPTLRNLDKVDKVCTRFPPEPSGYLHIGHAKAALLNSQYAKMHNGIFRVRFDDTNPTAEKTEFVDAILEDLKTLGITPTVPITFTSDYFDEIQNLAIKLIKDGNAYVDFTPHDLMKEERDAGIISKCRDHSVEENLRLFNEMLAGSDEGQKCLLRAKIDWSKEKEGGEPPMQTLNKCLRDPGMYRCVVGTPHHRTGVKYKAYPLYDFACPIVDSIEGVTHALRSSEYHDRNPLYEWVIRKLGIREVYIEDFSRLNFSYTLLSKRKLQWFVNEKKVEGWDSPAFPTIRGIIRRGMKVDALLMNVAAQGASKSVNLMQIDKLWVINKQMIDDVIPRHTAINKDSAVKVVLENGPDAPFMKSLPAHKKNPDVGQKIVQYAKEIVIEPEDAASVAEGETVTLMDWGNCIIQKINKDGSGKVTSISAKLDPDNRDFKKTKKFTWLALSDDTVTVRLHYWSNLITKEKLDEGDDFKDFIPDPLHREEICYGDCNLRNIAKSQHLQLERRGYFICDSIYHRDSDILNLILIPDGKSSKPSSA